MSNSLVAVREPLSQILVTENELSSIKMLNIQNSRSTYKINIIRIAQFILLSGKKIIDTAIKYIYLISVMIN